MENMFAVGSNDDFCNSVTISQNNIIQIFIFFIQLTHNFAPNTFLDLFPKLMLWKMLQNYLTAWVIKAF